MEKKGEKRKKVKIIGSSAVIVISHHSLADYPGLRRGITTYTHG